MTEPVTREPWEDIVFGPESTTTTTTLTATPQRTDSAAPYIATAIIDETSKLAATAHGQRNHTLNIAALKLGALPGADRNQIRALLIDACHTNGLIADDGAPACHATIDSAFRKADDNPRTIPARTATVLEVPATQIATTAAADGGDPGSAFGLQPPLDAGHFLFDHDDTTLALWGDGDNILWAEGEALMIAGGMGLGKTTLAGQIIRAQLGLNPNDVLGLPVTPISGKILYLAMDRPRQIRRSMLRQFDATDRDSLTGRLLIRIGPPIADIALYPTLLAKMCAEAGAAVVYVDSLKDAAIGLSDDKVGAAWNRARQQALADGVQVCELHHNRKAVAGAIPTGSVSDIYGSTWLTSGAGSVITLTGEPGDPIVDMRHVKQPLNEVGPFRLLHNHDAGLLTVEHQVDLLLIAKVSGGVGLTAQAAAGALFDTDRPSRAQVEKARYRLDKLAGMGLLVRVDGMKGGAAGVGASAWFTPHE